MHKGHKQARTFLHGKMKEYAYSKGKFANFHTKGSLCIDDFSCTFVGRQRGHYTITYCISNQQQANGQILNLAYVNVRELANFITLNKISLYSSCHLHFHNSVLKAVDYTNVNRGYYMPARGYEFYLRVVNSISHE